MLYFWGVPKSFLQALGLQCEAFVVSSSIYIATVPDLVWLSEPDIFDGGDVVVARLNATLGGYVVHSD